MSQSTASQPRRQHPRLPTWDDVRPAPFYEFTAGKLHVDEQFRRSVIEYAERYEELADLCTNHEMPRKNTLGRLAHLTPVIYVKQVTREPHYGEWAPRN